MHIKNIIIQGFKTYKNTTTIDDLSPKHNVVVGRNGSGKSNFFAAIRFVLSDAYTHMTREERQGLVHEGSGTVMSAYVEIIFDNTDGRFPINKSEIAIRRTIGLKKDDYALDSKATTRADIMNLLESAGFSRSNPYYIVPQGKITNLTNFKDSERLDVLKEVSGANIFEKKLLESTNELRKSGFKKQTIDDSIVKINERLNDLQSESNDLKEYQKLEKTRKIYEYNIFDREFENLNESIESVESKYDSILEQSQKDLEELEQREKLFLELNEQVGDLKIKANIAKLEKEQSTVDYDQLLKDIAEKKVVYEEHISTVERNEAQVEENKRLTDQYTKLIQNHEVKIAEIRPNLQKLTQEESELKVKLSDLFSKQRALYSKQTRFLKFLSKKQRDKWLSDEISRIKKSIQAKDLEINQFNLEVKGYETRISAISTELDELTVSMNEDSYNEKRKSLQRSVQESKDKMSELNDERKTLWRENMKIKSLQDSIKNDYNLATNMVNQTMTRAQAQGLASVKAITQKLNLTKNVYGPLAELFNVGEKYKVATEVVAGNSLFHVVVDNDNTASMIMEELNRNKSGRVTFIPLNRIDVPVVNYPDTTENQCIPLMKKLKYDGEVEKAMRQVFGKTIVVRDLPSGSELARAYKLTAITLDGDRADTKGVLSGGYRDYKKSRFDAIKLQGRKKKELAKAEQDFTECSDKVDKLNQQLTDLHNELQVRTQKLDKFESSREPITIEISQLTNKQYNLNQEFESVKSKLLTVLAFKSNLLINLTQLEKELNSKFADSLTEDELKELESLNAQIKENELILDELVSNSSELDMKLSVYESELNNNYKPNLAKLAHQKIVVIPNNLDAELEQLNIKLDTVESKLTMATDQLSSINEEIEKCESTINKSNNQQLKIIKSLENFSKNSEAILNKKSIMINRRDEIEKKIRDLGVLPEDAFDKSKYDTYSSEQLLEKLNKTNEDLNKYSNVNKKALEQYNNFTREHESLIIQRADLDASSDSIEKLITNLQTQKDEAIKNSFLKISESFHQIFGKLVPLGVGNLVIQKDGDNIESYVGVSIEVSFNSKHDEQQRIEQLSGGQKSLCAIALILAIQNYDPAPFYLLDEIDANLDSQYRTAVATMISSLSSKAQFICTTFRPEMLQLADKFYGVSFGNKVSTISEINLDRAMDFVESQETR